MLTSLTYHTDYPFDFPPNGFSVFVCDVNEKVIASIDLTYKYPVTQKA